ncbi:MAG: hypothetical protein IPN95_18320 [Bacteroidetes bacterium]|nr:hypothetical protein [Bacteroidota bacterium]
MKVNVPWTNKQLQIEFATFRDKLLPGAKEEWLVKIKGPKGEKVVAELLATMYDQSLDAFRTQSWEWRRCTNPLPLCPLGRISALGQPTETRFRMDGIPLQDMPVWYLML